MLVRRVSSSDGKYSTCMPMLVRRAGSASATYSTCTPILVARLAGAAPSRNTIIAVSVSWLAATFVISGVPVEVPAEGKACELTVRKPFPPTLSALVSHPPAGGSVALSLLTAQAAKARVLAASVVRALGFGELSFCLLAKEMA